MEYLGRAIGHRVSIEAPLCPDCCHERFDADDVRHSREIAGEHGECHLGGNIRQGLCQQVRRAHPRLHGAKWMFDSRVAPWPITRELIDQPRQLMLDL